MPYTIMAFGKETEEKPKGRKPFFTGLIQNEARETIYRISLWQTEEFESFMKKLANKE
jgi:hypothetical protein